MIPVLYDLIYMLPVGIMASLQLNGGLNRPVPDAAACIVMMMSLGICLFLKYFDNRMKYLVPGMLVAAGTGIVLIHKREERQTFLLEHSWILWMVLLAAACYLVCRLITQYIWVRRAFATVLAAMLIVMMVRGSTGSKVFVAAAFLPLLSAIVEEIQLYWNKSGYTEHKGHLVSVSPFVLAVCIAVFLLPSSDRPYDWGFVKKICEGAVEAARWTADLIHLGDEDYGAVIGFSDESGFSDSLKRDVEEMLTVRFEGEAPEVLYLTGKTFDTFDGREWTTSYTKENNDRMQDTLETLEAVKKYDPEHLEEYIKRTDMGIEYLEFRTRYVFAPLKPIPGTVRPDKPGYTQKGGDLISKKRLTHGSAYSLSYYRMNQDKEGFRELILSVKPSMTEKDIEYRRRQYSCYLPETEISDRMKAYLEKEMKGCESDLDRLKKLESILGSFTYSTEGGGLPESVKDPAAYLDHLFFESRQGYCSHFATAFVLLARSMGIPARYAQGFRIANPGTGRTIITSDMAHAWPEAYIDGLGWISFEPTPGMKLTSSWEASSEKEESVHEIYDHKPEELTGDEEDGSKEGDGENGILVKGRAAVLPVILCLVFLVIYIMVYRIVSARRYKRLPVAKQFDAVCAGNMRILRALGYVMGDTQTLEEFGKMVSSEVPEENLEYIACMEKTRYGDQEADSEMLTVATENEAALMELLRQKKGRWYYTLFRIWGPGFTARKA
jgi:hypothetical protein